MSDQTAIEWTDATFNPWWGCTKVSPGCDHCYAERDAKRYAAGTILWGDGSTRRTFSEAHWQAPLRWARTMPAKLGRRPRVFCASMADVFDKDGPEDERRRLWATIAATPELDWQLLTKRVGNVARMVPSWWMTDGFPANAWLGATIVSREEMLRDAEKLKALPTRVSFWSVEPQIGDLGDIPRELMPGWVIAGGESGPHARPMHPDWARSLRDQCAAAGVPFLFKQWGEWREAQKGDRFDTTYGEGSRPAGLLPAFILDRRDGTVHCFHNDRFEAPVAIVRVGKKTAGRELDGQTHDGYPAAVVAT